MIRRLSAVVATLGLVAAISLLAVPAFATGGGNHGGGHHHPTWPSGNPNSPDGGALYLACVAQLLAPDTNGADFSKTITNAERNGQWTYEISFAYTTTRPDGVYRVRDCAFIDNGSGNGSFNAFLETVVGGTLEQLVSIQNGQGTGSVTVWADDGDVVCDRLSMRSANPAFVDRSNVACIQLGDAEVPIGAIGGIGLAALSTGFFGIAYLANRRKVHRLRGRHAITTT